MILSELRDYLRTRRRVALIDMSLHFGIDADALRGMLARWIAKGQVERLPVGTVCGKSCCHCDPRTTEIYAWVQPPADD